jgi:regulatory protein
MKPLSIGEDEAWKRITRYCAYQERCHSETRDKLYTYGLYAEQVEELLGRLISENYLNEERFSLAFARGKSRLKGWGTKKIELELKRRQVSEWCVRRAIQSLDQGEYNQAAKKVMEKKKALLDREKNPKIKLQKLKNFMLGKGYDWQTISMLLQDDNI